MRIRKPGVKRTPKPYHHGGLEEALIQAALAALERGNGGFTLRSLARDVGVSHAAPYAHFTDKQSLLASVARIGFERLRAQTLRAAALHPYSPSRQLAAVAAAYVRFAYEQPARYRLLFGSTIRDFRDFPELEAASNAAFTALADTLAAAAPQDGKPPGLKRKARVTWSMLHGLTSLAIDQRSGFREESPADVERFAGEAVDLLLRGLWS